MRIFGLILTFLFWLFLLVLFLEMPGCAPPGDYGSELLDVLEEPDVPFDQGPPEYGPECFKHEYFFCPPFGEVWQVLVTTNMCADPPEVVMGECEQVFECDPSTPNLGEQECTNPDGYPGMQDIVCDKGYI